MASDPTAGGAPAEMPVETSDPNLDIPPKPQGVAAEVQQLQAEKAELQDKLLRALAEAQNVRRRAQQDVERERKFGIERFGTFAAAGPRRSRRTAATSAIHWKRATAM